MTGNVLDNLSELFRTVESDLGTRDLTNLSILSFQESFDRFKPKDADDFLKQVNEVIEMIKSTKPRIALIIENFYVVWQSLQDLSPEDKKDLKVCRKTILHSMDQLNKKMALENKQLMEYGVKSIANDDTLLVHSHSHTVLDILRRAHSQGKKFRVIVAQQEIEKTDAIIEYLNEHRIHFHVVPEYMLSHIEGEIDKVFLGGLTLNSSYNFVTDSGTMSIVSEFHLAKKPIFMFISSSKFSMWKAKEVHHTYKVKSKKTHCRRGINYEHIKFSHDRVPLELFDYVVTELGSRSANETKKVFDSRFAERDNWRKTFFTDEN
jgi:translation initiation factor 2B subunit (eIF-2B alpha/beta/delta family)